MIRQTPELLDRLPPQNLEAERSVLGSVLIDPRCIDDLAGKLSGDDFYADANQKLWKALASLHDKRRPIDALTLADHLKRAGDYEAIGGASYLAEVVQSVPHALHAAYYASLVIRASRLRAIIHATTDALRDSYSPTEDPEDILKRLDSDLAAIHTGEHRGDPVPILVACQEALDRIDALQDPNRGARIPSGLVPIDTAIGGFFPGELAIIAARPGIGKTSLALQIANHNAARGRLTYFATLEMSRAELATRTMCGKAQVSNRMVRSGSVGAEERDRLAVAANEVAGTSMVIHERAGMTVADIRRGARRYTKDGLALVCVDYLQLITPEDRKAPREQQVARMAAALKELARELTVPVLCLCQLNRQVDEYDRPSLLHLRESGAIEQDADTVIFIYKHRPANGEQHNSQLSVAKNRNAETGEIELVWIPERTCFEAPSLPRYIEFDSPAEDF